MQNFWNETAACCDMHACAACGELLGRQHFVAGAAGRPRAAAAAAAGSAAATAVPAFDPDDPLWGPLDGIRLADQESLHICLECLRFLQQGLRPPRAAQLFKALEPELHDLSAMELRCIKPILPFIAIYLLRGKDRQYGSMGHTISFPNDAMAVAARLPRLPSKTATAILVEESAKTGVTRLHTIRPAAIRAALLFAITSKHVAFRNVAFDEALMRQLEEEVARFETATPPVPVEVVEAEQGVPVATAGGAEDLLMVYEQDTDRALLAEALARAQPVGSDARAGLEQLAATYHAEAGRQMPGAEAASNGAVEAASSAAAGTEPSPGSGGAAGGDDDAAPAAAAPPTLRLSDVQPRSAAPPVGEREAGDDLWIGCFPHLYAGGVGGPSCFPGLSIEKYVNHCLMYYDQRFAQCPEFLFFAYNFIWRKRINGVLSVASKRAMDSSSAAAGEGDAEGGGDGGLTVGALRNAGETLLFQHGMLPRRPPDSVLQEGYDLLGRLSVFGESLPGTAAEMELWRTRLLALIGSDVTDPAFLFHTVSPADAFWPEFFKMLGFKDRPEVLNARRDCLSRLPFTSADLMRGGAPQGATNGRFAAGREGPEQLLAAGGAWPSASFHIGWLLLQLFRTDSAAPLLPAVLAIAAIRIWRTGDHRSCRADGKAARAAEPAAGRAAR